MEKLNINQWAEDDRPREKLMKLGPEALSNAELLAILIGSGSTKESAVDLMKRVLSDCKNNLNTLGKMSIRELCEYKGVGEAKAITILAACELGKRRQMESPEERPDIGTATRIYNYMHPLLQDLRTNFLPFPGRGMADGRWQFVFRGGHEIGVIYYKIIFIIIYIIIYIIIKLQIASIHTSEYKNCHLPSATIMV